MIKINGDNLYKVNNRAIIAHYPVNGESQDQFRAGENAVSWAVLAITGNGYRLAASDVATDGTVAKELRKPEELVDGNWWIYESGDLKR